MTIDEFVAIRYGTPVRRETDLQQMFRVTGKRDRDDLTEQEIERLQHDSMEQGRLCTAVAEWMGRVKDRIKSGETAGEAMTEDLMLTMLDEEMAGQGVPVVGEPSVLLTDVRF